jgi:hypothetical protein
VRGGLTVEGGAFYKVQQKRLGWRLNKLIEPDNLKATSTLTLTITCHYHCYYPNPNSIYNLVRGILISIMYICINFDHVLTFVNVCIFLNHYVEQDTDFFNLLLFIVKSKDFFLRDFFLYFDMITFKIDI